MKPPAPAATGGDLARLGTLTVGRPRSRERERQKEQDL